MKIKNYIVENYQLFMGYLEEDLCKKGISYVRIDNEIHFLDQIIRFYDFELDKKVIIESEIFKPNIKKEELMVYVPERNYIPEIKLERVSRFKDDIKCYQPRTKFVQKQESNLTKQKIKRYSR